MLNLLNLRMTRFVDSFFPFNPMSRHIIEQFLTKRHMKWKFLASDLSDSPRTESDIPLVSKVTNGKNAKGLGSRQNLHVSFYLKNVIL